MIDLYTWTTPNGRKISIALEEMDLPYEVHTVNIGENEQFAPDFLKISPNNKIPAIVDRDTGTSVFESGAVLIYLAEKSGMFLPTPAGPRAKVLEWLFWQVGGFGPMLGQLGHFTRSAKETVPYAIERYTTESKRLFGVLEKRLGEADYVGGEYSIADMSIYPWTGYALDGLKGMDKSFAAPNVEAWLARVGARAGVKAGMAVPVV